MKSTCQSCKHFEPLEQQCRAHAPNAALVPTGPGQFQAHGYWPGTRKDFWCGEYVHDGSQELPPGVISLGAPRKQ